MTKSEVVKGLEEIRDILLVGITKREETLSSAITYLQQEPIGREELRDFIEKGADLEHQRWAGWQEYLHSLCIKNQDGSLTIPKERVERWERQIKTTYGELPEEEKEFDRIEVRKYLALLPQQEVMSEEEIEKIIDKYQRNSSVSISPNDIKALAHALSHIPAGKEEAVFTNRELDYIYNYLDCVADKELYRSIENKIRKQNEYDKPLPEKTKEDKFEYCNCLGLRIHDRNDINCMRCGKLLQKKTYTCPNCGQYSMDRFELDKVKCNRCGWITDLYEAIKASEPEKTYCECEMKEPNHKSQCVNCGLPINFHPEKTCLNCGNLGTCEPPCSKWQPQEVKVIEPLIKQDYSGQHKELRDKINEIINHLTQDKK